MQINTSSVLNLSIGFEYVVFEKQSLILKHQAKMFLIKNDNFIENEEIYTDFKKCLTFDNNRHHGNISFKNYSEVLPDNFNVARSSLNSLERKFNSNAKSDIVARI